MEEEADIRVLDVAKALAFIGDLSMGQPTDHSVRTAWLAAQVAADAGYGTNQCDVVKQVALLRWSGCTANAHGFAQLIGDDVAEREAMLARRPDSALAAVFARGEGAAIAGLAQIHCEVSGEIARMLALDHDTEVALRNIFENRDGTGLPNHVAGDGVPRAVSTVSLAGDLEILSRVYGLDAALTLLTKDAGSRYPAELVDLVSQRGRQWHEALEHEAGHDFDGFLTTDRTQQLTSPELIADVIDLKLPWMTQYSRRVAQACARCCAALGVATSTQRLVYRAGLIHGMGRTSVSNSVWNTSGKLSAAAWEKIRLVPYWTQRAGKNIAALEPEAAIASFAYERLDGSGYFRSASGREISLEARVLSTAVAWIALRSPRPWREPLSFEEAARTLTKEAQAGRFDADVVVAMTSSEHTASVRTPDRVKRATLSEREVDVLRHISQGASNKEVARTLGISMSTVGTHMEKVFRKLDCSTRAAATLKASAMGLL